MASPDDTKSAPKSPPVQDSPIYQYVSSLSPIKPVNARPDGHAYENTCIPSPQVVFKTPNFNRQTNLLDLRERYGHLAGAGSENISPGYAGNSTSFSGNMEVYGSSVSLPMSQSTYCNLKECGNAEPSPDQPTVSPSSCVAAYLANPVESDDNLSSSPEFCVKRAVKDTQVYNAIMDENNMKCFKEDPAKDDSQPSTLAVNELVDYGRKSSTPSVLHDTHSKQHAEPPRTIKNASTDKESTQDLQAIDAKKDASSKSVDHFRAPCQNEEHLGKEPIIGVSLTAPHRIEENPRNLHISEDTFNINEVSNGKQLGPLPKNAGENSESLFMPPSTSHLCNLTVNQYAADLSVVSINEDCDMDNHGKENFSMSSQGPQDLNLRASKEVQCNLECTPQLHLDSPHNMQENVTCVDNSGSTVVESTGKLSSYDQDGAQHQRGKRKRLQFEAVNNLRMSVGCSSNSCIITLEDSNVDSPITPLETESIDASHAEPVTVSSSKLVVESVPGNFVCRSVNVDICEGYQGSFPVNVPRPSGIGLHLNSIVSSGSTICNKNTQMPTREADAQEDKCFVEHNDQILQKSKIFLASTSSLGPSITLTSSSEHPLSYAATTNYEEKHPEERAILVPTSSNSCQSPLFVKPLNKCLPSKLNDLYITPCATKRLSSEDFSRSGESTQSSPRKKRKKAPGNEAHKRCNCKRSKCLKLYCDCFAAGSFCSEACACQGCFNKSEHEDIVRETRQQIESRNPLAFAPKVVVRVVDPPKDSGDNKPITPTSARHKRGCNCKKSLCLKRYCECYQAGVGCSFGCRCEGCKNTFGTRDGIGGMSEMVVEHKRPKETSWERNLSSELESIEVIRESANMKQTHSRLSPITPSVQTSLGNHVPKPQLPASYYPSPDSSSSCIPSYESFNATTDPIQTGAFAREGEGSSALVPYGPDAEYHNAGDVNAYSPGWEGFPEMCNLSPLLKTPLAGGSSSASKSGEHKVLLTKLFQGSGTGNLCLRTSPVTPLPRFGESKFVNEPDSDNGPHGNPEDDTPEILRDYRVPIKTVKATSPNQKRVSPPHHVMNEARSNSPSVAQSARKYILQSVPAFPSLTPFSNNTKGDGT